MLNTPVNVREGNTSNSMNIHAVSGTLVRNHLKSFFKRFHADSSVDEGLFNSEPYYTEGGRGFEEKVPVHVLQVMLVGEGQYLAEIVRIKDFDA